MSSYRKIEQSEKSQLAHPLLDQSTEEDDRSSSDDTVVATSSWYRHTPRQSISMKKLIFLSIVTTTNVLVIVMAIAWTTVKLGSNHASIQSLLDYPSTSTKHKSATKTTNQPQIPVSICGHTAEEAIRAGCHFNMFSFAWTPRECSDPQLHNDSLTVLHHQLEGAPAFYIRDTNSADHLSSKNTPLSISEVENYGQGVGGRMSDDTEVLATWEHYLVACTHGWQKVQRAAMRNWPLEEWSASYALATRCGPDLLEREKRPSESILLHLRPWFARCGLEAEDMRREVEQTLSMRRAL